MYSDSIRERQQELLDVLFKKASGRSEAAFIKSAWPQLTDDDVNLMRQQLMGKDQRTLAKAQEAKVKKELALKEEFQRLVAEYKRNNPNGKFTDVTKSNLMRNAERNVKDRSVQESYKQMEQAHRRGMTAFSTTPSVPTTTPAEPIIPSPEQTPLSGEDTIIDPTSGVEIPDPVDVGEVEFEGDSDGTTAETPTEPATQAPATTTPTQAPAKPATQAPTSTPATTPTTAPVNPATSAPAQTPATPSTTPGGSQGGSENNGGGGTTSQPPAVRAELDWNKVLKGLIEKLKRHKMVGIGGLGGFGLGALIGGGGSFTDRLLWALLGGGAGTGLGYLVEKYLK